MPRSAALDRFGLLLMSRVRDASIRQWDKVLRGEMKDNASQGIHEALGFFDAKQVELVRRLIPNVVDTTIHHFLWTLEQEEWIEVAAKAPDGEEVNLAEASDGLTGELYSKDGWISRFSKERKGDIV